MILFYDIDDQRILQSDWTIQLKVVVFRPYIPLASNSMQKKNRCQLIVSRDIDNQRILQADWTRDITGHTQPKVVASDAISLDDLLLGKNLRYRLIPFTDIHDKRIPQSDWLRVFQTIPELPDFPRTCGFCGIIKNIVIHHF